jgi:hypothetical protein
MIGLFAAAWLSCSYPPETARILQARPPTAAVAMDAPAFWAIVVGPRFTSPIRTGNWKLFALSLWR